MFEEENTGKRLIVYNDADDTQIINETLIYEYFRITICVRVRKCDNSLTESSQLYYLLFNSQLNIIIIKNESNHQFQTT